MEQNSDNSRCKKGGGGHFLGLGIGTLLGVMLGGYILRKLNAFENKVPRHFIDTIRQTDEEGGVVLYSFGWNDNLCTWSKSAEVDKKGFPLVTNLLMVEVLGDMIVITEGVNEDDDTPMITTAFLNETGGVVTVVRRYPSGKEERWDYYLEGDEVKSVTTKNACYTYEWEQGNLVRVLKDGVLLAQMSYHPELKNHLSPDLNYLHGFTTTKALLSDLMGVRSRNLLASVEEYEQDKVCQRNYSYVLDTDNRPVKILQEEVQTVNGRSSMSNKRYSITYTE